MILLLHLIRHAESQNNVRPAYSRVEDPPLTAAGMLQARYLAERFMQLEFDRLICSPFLRALQTTRSMISSAVPSMCGTTFLKSAVFFKGTVQKRWKAEQA